jgi:hypothetical protein
MPTFEAEEPFLRDFRKLSSVQKDLFLSAVSKFVDDLRHGSIRKGLRVKRFLGREGVWEMTWADDGRALFRYGSSIRPGDPHVVWLRVGSHGIFEDR